MDSLASPGAGFVRRHRWGIVTLAAAAFVWGAGAVAMPAPAIVGGALAAVGGLAVLAIGRYRARRRRAGAAAERERTRVSTALYATSFVLCAIFLAGLFAAPRTVTLVGSPAVAATVPRMAATVPALAGWLPALASVRAVASVDRFDAKLPRLYELGTRRPLAAGAREASGARAAIAGRGEPASAVEPQTAPETLRVLSLNVWHGYPGSGAHEERYRRIRALLEEAEPDVVLLQEAWSTRAFGRLAERLSRELDLGYAYARANGSLRYLGFEEGLSILSRHPLSAARRLALGPRTPPWEMRAALSAVVTLPGGETLEIWNTHLSHSSAVAREGQARSLAAALDGSRVALLAGDFNAGASSAPVAAFAALDLHPVLSDGIDHILGSADLLARWTPVRTEARRFGRVALAAGRSRPEVSDHPALLVELRRKRGALS